jgi:hypothetical protein
MTIDETRQEHAVISQAELARLRAELEAVNALGRQWGYGQGELDDDLAGCLARRMESERAAREAAERRFATVTAERDGWKQQHDMVLSQARKDNLRAEDADRYEQWLLDLGRISGCGHVDERLPRCIEEAFAAAQQRVERLREAIRALLALHVTNGPLEVIEYGPGGTTEEEVAHRQIIEAIHQATLTTEATNES